MLAGESREARAEPIPLKIELIGGVGMRIDGRAVTLPNRKASCMLGYLALHSSGRETRERLCGLLWSEVAESKARASLRQCLHELQEALTELDFTGLTADRESIALDLTRISVDIVEIDRGLARGELDTRLRQDDIADRLMSGLEAADPAFDAWLTVKRNFYSEHLGQQLERLLGRADAPAEHRRTAADALMRLDPTNETACRAAIEQAASAGNVAGALRLYKRLWDLLDAEYDMEPSEPTQQLIARIKLEAPAPGAPSPAPPTAPVKTPAPIILPGRTDRPRVSVAAFSRGGVPAAQGYVVDGMQRELVAALVRFRDWVVVDAPPDAADRSYCDYELEGSCFPAEGGLHVVVLLKEAASRRFVWSERHVVETEGWVKAQQRIVQRIGLALNVYLSADRVARRLHESATDFPAYDKWLRGQSLIAEWRPEAETEAEQIFRSIIQEAPDFAPPYASLASIQNSRHIVFPGVFRNPRLEAEAHDLAGKAVALDPLDTRSQLALAWSNAMRGRYDQAEFYYDLSFDLNSSDPATLISCAQGLAFCGRTERARRLADLAVTTNPMMPNYHWGYLVGVNFACGDYAGSVAAADRAQDVIFNLPGWRAAALAHLGRRQEAREAGARLIDLARRNWVETSQPEDSTVLRWFLHSFPIREPAVFDRLQEGLRLAGLPVTAG